MLDTFSTPASLLLSHRTVAAALVFFDYQCYWLFFNHTAPNSSLKKEVMMNMQSKRTGWFFSLGLLVLVLSACGGGDGAGSSEQAASENETGQQAEPEQQNPVSEVEAELKYIESTSVVVKALWLRDSEGVETQVLTEPRTFRFKPSEAAYTDIYAELSISPGVYDQVRIVFDSAEVQLSKDAYLATGLDVVEKTEQADTQPQDPFVFSTEQGRLIFPAEFNVIFKYHLSIQVKYLHI